MAYEQIAGPLGPERGDYHAAQIAAAVLNAARGKRGRVAQIKDLLIKWDPQARRSRAQDPHEMLRAVKAINRAMGGAELTKGGTDVDDSGRADRQGRRGRRRR
jgi:hypothetical protein